MIYHLSCDLWNIRYDKDKSPYAAQKDINMIEGMIRNKNDFNGDMYSSTNRTEP